MTMYLVAMVVNWINRVNVRSAATVYVYHAVANYQYNAIDIWRHAINII